VKAMRASLGASLLMLAAVVVAGGAVIALVLPA